MSKDLFVGAVIGLGVADCICYALAKYPERASMRLWWLPGSGIYALVRYGRD